MNLDISVKTYGITSPSFGTAVNRIFLVAEEIDGKDKLYENYNFDGLKVSEWIAVSIFEDVDSNCIGFSSVNKRPEIWGNNVRILNRFMKIYKHRFENKKGAVSEVTKKMIKQQLKVSAELGYQNAFMSRESNTKAAAFKHYVKHLDFAEWHISPNRHRMFLTDEYLPSAWQHIMWTPLKFPIESINIEHITEEQFNALRKR